MSPEPRWRRARRALGGLRGQLWRPASSRKAELLLRQGTAALAAGALVAGFAGGVGLAATVLGAAVGVWLGERLASGRARLPVLLVGLLACSWLGFVGARVVTGLPLVARALGPGTALLIAAVLRYGALSVAVLAALRVTARRVAALRPVELAALTACFAAAFAAHRGGRIARPLWLSDPAWAAGFDPGQVLLLLGTLFAAALALVEVMGARQRRRRLALVVLPLLVLVVWVMAPQAEREPPVNTALQEVQDGYCNDVGMPGASGASDGLADDAEGDSDQADPEQRDPEQAEQGQGGEQADQPPTPTRPDSGEGARPELADEGDPARPEFSDEGQPVRPEQSDEGQPVQPEEGDGSAEQQNDGVQESQDAPSDGDQPRREALGGAEEEREEGGSGSADQEQGEGSSGSADQEEQQVDGAADSIEDALDAEACCEDVMERRASQPDEMSTEGGGSSRSDEPVAVLLLEDDYTPPQQVWYLRQEPHSEYNGFRMVPSEEGWDRDFSQAFGGAEERFPAPQNLRRRQVSGSVVLITDHDQPFALESPILLQERANPHPARFVRAYGFTSWSLEPGLDVLAEEVLAGKASPKPPGWSAEQRAHYLEGPADPRYAELAESLVAELNPELAQYPLVRALAIKVYLDAGMTYSTAARHADVDDPTASFLFGDMTGYCVHAAHAAVYLMRAVGVPARVGTGYAVAASDRRGSTLLVRAGDAHAWPEIFLPETGWTVMDINPSSSLDEPRDPLDEDLARLLGEMAREEPPQSPRRRRRWRLALTWIDLRDALVLAGGFALLGHYLAKLWRRLALRWSPQPLRARVGYRLALTLLSEAGRSRRYGETRESFARRLRTQTPSFEQLTRWHLNDALGDPARPLASRQELSAEGWAEGVASLRRELAGSAPWWRRVLGALDPTSLYRAR